MKLIELKQITENLGRDFESHKILFHEKINYAIIAAKIFNNPKVSELITILENMPYIKKKLELSVELVRWIATKRFAFTNDYFKDLKTAFKCALLYFFDFKSIAPIRYIKGVYQEEIERGNHVVLHLDSRYSESPIMTLLAILLAEKLREMINASAFHLKNRRPRLREIVDKRFPNLSITYKYILADFLENFEEKIAIQIIDNNKEERASKFFLDSLIEKYDFTIELLEIIDKDFWLRNIIKKYIDFIKNSILENYEKDCKMTIISEEINKKILVAEELENSDISKIAFLPNELKRTLLLRGQLSNDAPGQMKLYIPINEDVPNKNVYTTILPLELRDKQNDSIEISSYRFVCESCGEIGYTSYCEKCKREKRIAYFCEKCGIANLAEECISCGKEVSPLFTINIIPSRLFNLNANEEACYKKIKYVEPFFKPQLRTKYDIKISEKGATEIELKVLPSNEIVIDGTTIELKENEILLPRTAVSHIQRVTKYLKETLETFYNSKEIGKINFEINEGSDLLISRSTGIVHYIVKIKRILDIEYAVIHPFLYELLFSEATIGNLISLYIPMDFLLNASALYFEDEAVCYIITEPPIPKERPRQKLKVKLQHPGLTEEESFSTVTLNFRLKYKLLKEIVEVTKSKIETSIKCPKCGNAIGRPPIFLRCSKCGSKLNYRWGRKELMSTIKEFDSILQAQDMMKKYKRINRKIKWFISDYLKEEEHFERLDKFFSQ